MNTEILDQDEFTLLLKKFNTLIEKTPSPESISEKLKELKEEATLSNELTFWQKDAIIKRYENYANGTYGSTSREHKVQARVKG